MSAKRARGKKNKKRARVSQPLSFAEKLQRLARTRPLAAQYVEVYRDPEFIVRLVDQLLAEPESNRFLSFRDLSESPAATLASKLAKVGA